ncbi:MAG: xylulokinase [bacterium]|nr:xylulokinase [bacterium]
MTYFMGIDISTTSAKALIIDETGAVIALGSTPQPISQPYPLWSEQNPLDWWQGVVGAIGQALASARLSGKDIRAIGLTGQMHGLVMLDSAGRVLRPAILWNDQRTQAQCETITEKIGAERLIELTGNRALTGFTAPKILWVREHEPDVYAQCAHILLPKDYIRYCLSGNYAMDMADGSGTLLMNVAQRTWSGDVVSALDIPSSWLPRLYEGSEITGVVSAEASRLTGLADGTPIIAGGGDQAAGAIGMGCVSPDKIGITIGTSGVVFAPLNAYGYEPHGRLHAFCHAVPNQWHFMGVMLSAAGSLQWYRDTIAPDVSFDDLLAETATIPAGSEGLFFLPYLTGERTPHPDPNARGAFIGLTTRHTRAHMTRAVLEGVAYGLRDSFTLIAETSLPKNYEIRISGGGAKSPIWQHIIADVLGAKLVNINTTEGGAFGAALLASVGVGVYQSVAEACEATIQTGAIVEPTSETTAYQAFYPIYQSLYSTLKQTFAQIADL